MKGKIRERIREYIEKQDEEKIDYILYREIISLVIVLGKFSEMEQTKEEKSKRKKIKK